MSLADKEAAVLAAELRCEGQRQHAKDTLGHLKSEFRRGATPLRIVLSGLGLGFVSGLRSPGAGAGGISKLLGGPVMSLVMETVLPSLLASVTAAAAVEEKLDEAPVVTVEPEAVETAAGESEVVEVEAEEDIAPKPRRRRRRKKRVDA